MTNILCINGGGVRGIIPLTIIKILNKYENILNKIDIVSGSSIGGIIACCLVLPDNNNNYKYNIGQIINLFIFMMNKIFNIGWYNYIYSFNGLIKSKYDDKIINELLFDIFGNTRVEQLLKKIIIPCYDMNNNKSIVFTSDNNGNLLVRDILRGTIAAPTYFKPYEIVINNINMKLIDGGIVDNNTSRICLINEIYEEKIKIINLGTGYIKPVNFYNYGIINWIPNIISIIMNGEINEDINECKNLLGDKFLLIDTLIDNKYYCMDNPKFINYYIENTVKNINSNYINKYIEWCKL